MNELDYFGVLFFGPRAFDEVGIENFLPSLLTLVLAAYGIGEMSADGLPVFGAGGKLFAKSLKHFVFLFGPSVLCLDRTVRADERLIGGER